MEAKLWGRGRIPQVENVLNRQGEVGLSGDKSLQCGYQLNWPPMWADILMKFIGFSKGNQQQPKDCQPVPMILELPHPNNCWSYQSLKNKGY